MVGKNKFVKTLAVLLSVLMAYIPSVVYAGQQDPDDSLNLNGRLTYLGKDQRTPYAGVLFDITAATKLKLDKQFAALKFKLELDFKIKELEMKYKLKLDTLQVTHDSLKIKTDSLLKIKNDEITRLQDLVKKNPNDYTHWWFAGGVIAGILLSMGIYFAAAEANK